MNMKTLLCKLLRQWRICWGVCSACGRSTIRISVARTSKVSRKKSNGANSGPGLNVPSPRRLP